MDEIVDGSALKAFRRRAADSLGRINTATQRAVTQVLSEGLSNGTTLAEMAVKIKEATLGLEVEVSASRAFRIAWFETTNALSEGRREAARAAGVKRKWWLHSRKPTGRETHIAAERETSQAPIPIDEPFIVAGEALMRPRDPAGSAGNVINCACIAIYSRPRAGRAFYGWRQFKREGIASRASGPPGSGDCPRAA